MATFLAQLSSLLVVASSMYLHKIIHGFLRMAQWTSAALYNDALEYMALVDGAMGCLLDVLYPSV